MILKRSVQLRYQETVDVREFEPKIQKLLDDHVVAMPAETIIEVVNINDPDALKAVVKETGVSEASRADRIASATRRAITEKMDADPTFYKQFSELLEETILAYREKRLSERDYLNSVVDLASKVARKDRGRDVPESIRGDENAQAFFGILDGQLKTKGEEQVAGDEAAYIALGIIGIIKSHLIVDIWSNEVAQNNLRNAIDDYFFDVLRDEKGVDLPVQVLDDLELKIITSSMVLMASTVSTSRMQGLAALTRPLKPSTARDRSAPASSTLKGPPIEGGPDPSIEVAMTKCNNDPWKSSRPATHGFRLMEGIRKASQPSQTPRKS